MSLESPSWREREILTELRNPIEAGEIEVYTGEQALFDRLALAFPLADVRIDWRAVPGHWVLPAPPARPSPQTPGATRPEVLAFWDRARRAHGVGDDQPVIVLGDGVWSFGFKMSVHTLTRELAILLSYPQHTYVVPPDASWCFSHTFEGDAFFGLRPPTP